MTESERDRMQLELASKPAFTPQRSGIKRSKQDVEGAKEVPLAVLRGRLAGLLGLPSDVGNIVRSPMPMEAFGDVDYTKPEQLPYGTEQFLQELPLAPKSAVGKLTGNVASFVPLNPAPAARAAGRVGKEVLREVAKGMEGKGALGRVIPQAVRPMNVVKPEGGNWISDSVEKALSPLKGMLREGETDLGKWVDSNLTSYVKNKMGTPSDPVRALAEKGITHLPKGAQTPRDLVGGGLLGKSPEAQAWETLSDSAIHSGTVGEAVGRGKGEPWMERVNPSTVAHKVSGGDVGITEGLGFEHLIDELRNASNPASGLPAALQIKPESLSKMSVPQAVERVAKINEWREANKVAANKALASNPATFLHKGYETADNPKGLHWVELREPEVKSIDKLSPEQRSWYDEYVQGGVSPATALVEASKRGKHLQQALDYEGSAMGHCVGGYCPDVSSGRKKIYSLRDAKGEPHVTIETSRGFGDPVADHYAQLDPQTRNEIRSVAMSRDPRGGNWGPSGKFLNGEESDIRSALVRQAAIERFPELATLQAPESIKQIKGKGNLKPKEEYLPFVQDFVKSGKWAEVDDFKNTGLLKKSDFIDEFTPERLDSVGVSEYITEADVKRLRDKQAPVASPYLQEILPAAEAEANLATYLDPSKEKGRWYTGTSSDIHEFNPALGLEKPGQAGATFVTENPDFTTGFAKDAHLTNPHPERYLTPEKIELAKENAKQYFRDTYQDMPEHADEMIKSIQAGKPVGEAEDALQGAYRELMPAGPNTMPVYVRTTNPFDFANPEHIASLKAIYPDLPALNRTSAIELPEVQDAIKAAGFDAFYTAEGGNRNLGLFQPTQLKSAIGNVGTYDVTNPLISKKDGGLVTMPEKAEDTAAFGIYPKSGIGRKNSGLGDKLNASLVPQDALDLALTVMPFGKVGKILATAIMAGAPAEAQAGNMSSLLKLVAREAPEQFHSIREALLRTFNTGLEQSVVGSTRMGGPSQAVGGTVDTVIPSKLDIAKARQNISQSPLIDFHTHPNKPVGFSDFNITPSNADLQYWMSQYGGSRTATTPNEIKTMIGSPANRQEGATSAYNFFATDKPGQALNRYTYDAALYELQRSKDLQSLKDNPVVGLYLDAGGTLGDLLQSASPMLLQKLYAQKGIGRHEMRLSNAPTAAPSVTESNLFNEIANPAMEVLKSKFANGGIVQQEPTTDQMRYELMMRRH